MSERLLSLKKALPKKQGIPLDNLVTAAITVILRLLPNHGLLIITLAVGILLPWPLSNAPVHKTVLLQFTFSDSTSELSTITWPKFPESLKAIVFTWSTNIRTIKSLSYTKSSQKNQNGHNYSHRNRALIHAFIVVKRNVITLISKQLFSQIIGAECTAMVKTTISTIALCVEPTERPDIWLLRKPPSVVGAPWGLCVICALLAVHCVQFWVPLHWIIGPVPCDPLVPPWIPTILRTGLARVFASAKTVLNISANFR